MPQIWTGKDHSSPHKLMSISMVLTCLFLASSSGVLKGQKAMLLEKANSLKTQKFFIGDDLTFALKSAPKDWRTATIVNIYVEERVIDLSNQLISIDSIGAIRVRAGGNFIKGLSTGLISFSGIWSFWTLVSLAYGDPLAWSTVAIAIGSFTVGKLLRFTFSRSHKFSGRKRLRLIDLTFEDKPSSGF